MTYLWLRKRVPRRSIYTGQTEQLRYTKCEVHKCAAQSFMPRLVCDTQAKSSHVYTILSVLKTGFLRTSTVHHVSSLTAPQVIRRPASTSKYKPSKCFAAWRAQTVATAFRYAHISHVPHGEYRAPYSARWKLLYPTRTPSSLASSIVNCKR